MSVLADAAVDFQVLGDQRIPINAERYIVRSIVALAAAPNRPAGAAAGLFTSANGGGICLVPHAQEFADAGGETYQELTMTAFARARVFSTGTLYLRVNTTCVVPSVGRLIIYGEKL